MESSLKGLERLMARCREQRLPLRLGIASTEDSTGRELFPGQPLDPLLAAVFRRVGDARLAELVLYASEGAHGLEAINRTLREQGAAPFPSCLVFGQVPSLAYRFALVPGLADSQGLQPVVFIDDHIEKEVLPVASNLDRFFDAYARSIESAAMGTTPSPDAWDDMDFPRFEPERVAQDTALVEMMRTGRFDGLVTRDEESQRWMQQVLDL
ncbi:hypothetical protein [Corallococcus exiguus]|uniref:Uncharacterized protein n=1 Tax=Corallococcus exiguus TaxID=83462 RepID=A0A7X4YDJ1_9BACT|nr:hypothetical protein [Corallococcus exiguus]NBC42754.1 hypothetical protein [Corallococcus exiguus]TNV59122.1 hypothetical protein FH620_27070 [Corallococcus exiguus]